jgi:hypothetical protein
VKASLGRSSQSVFLSRMHFTMNLLHDLRAGCLPYSMLDVIDFDKIQVNLSSVRLSDYVSVFRYVKQN